MLLYYDQIFYIYIIKAAVYSEVDSWFPQAMFIQKHIYTPLSTDISMPKRDNILLFNVFLFHFGR